MGNAHFALGNFSRSNALLMRALGIDEKYYGMNHPEVTKTLINLGRNYAILGDFKESQNCLERALTILEEYYGKDHLKLLKY